MMTTYPEKVWYYEPDHKWFTDRCKAKRYLGGTMAYNKALEKGELWIIPCETRT